MIDYDCDNCGAKWAKLNRLHMCPLPQEWKDRMSGVRRK